MLICYLFFFFNDTATTEIYTLSLHDALPISGRVARDVRADQRVAQLPQRVIVRQRLGVDHVERRREPLGLRSEEHTSELQSRQYLVCRLLLEKKKRKDDIRQTYATT